MKMSAITAPRHQFQAYPFHMVESSPWPLLMGNALLSMMVSAVLWFNGIEYSSLLLTLEYYQYYLLLFYGSET